MKKNGLVKDIEILAPMTIRKGEQKIQINSHLTAVCLLGAGYLLSMQNSNGVLLTIIMFQILCPIPLLITSSLAYLKVSNTSNMISKSFDTLAWWTHSIAYGMILNALALIAFYKGLVLVGWLFFAFYILLFFTYSLINLFTIKKLSEVNREQDSNKAGLSKLYNLLIYLFISFLGTVIPMWLTGWPYGQGK